MSDFKRYMTLASLVLVTGVFMTLGYNCSSTSIEEKAAKNSRSLPQSSRTPEMHNDQEKMQEEVKARYESMLRQLERESQKLPITSLKDKKLDGAEIRFWVGFGLAYPRCFIFERQRESRVAAFVGPRVVDGRAARDTKGNILFAKTTLAAPRSGWPQFQNVVEQLGIDSLALDKEYIAVPDGETIVIETKSDNTYRMVFYSLYTTSEDGQKALETCRRIEQEFGISMGCGERKS